MASKFSTALAKAIAGDQPWDAVLSGGKFLLFSGTVPATAETAVTSTFLIMPITLGDASWTAETQASMTATIAGPVIGQTIQLTVGGIAIHPEYTFASTNANTEATALATAIIRSSYNMGVRASDSSGVVTLKAPYGTGTLFNGAAVAKSGTGAASVTLSGDFGSGVAAVNGLTWERDATVLNKIIKPAAATWKGTCPGSVTTAVPATYFRYILDSGDSGYSDDTVNKAYRRWQGTIGGAGSTSADMVFPLASTSLVSGVVLTLSSYEFTIPLTN